eukprot:6445706-Amphidinium_carterae.1
MRSGMVAMQRKKDKRQDVCQLEAAVDAPSLHEAQIKEDAWELRGGWLIRYQAIPRTGVYHPSSLGQSKTLQVRTHGER